ncbi:hypothetical protein HK105_206664 [Polyrhizophydium stewartii]|uniref:PLOD1-3-like GT domain-containing protein n=1 Tax=Polyrhizophydium stewartii TaxID=2732419 RepID=A0ABR4N2P3_9FUNG|nr:hypothetical protein HK105_003488 [Polyrhizophydium stewartii]
MLSLLNGRRVPSPRVLVLVATLAAALVLLIAMPPIVIMSAKHCSAADGDVLARPTARTSHSRHVQEALDSSPAAHTGQALRPPAHTVVNAARNANLTIATFATSANRGFCDTILSAAAYGLVPTVIGWGDPWRGYRSKVVTTLAFLKSLPPENIVLFHDGFDVHFQASKQQLLAAFLRQNASILYMAEKNCWPMTDERCDAAFPVSPLPRWAWGPNTVYQAHSHVLNIPHFINAGTMMGYARTTTALFSEMARRVAEIELAGNKADDQEIVGELYLSGAFGIKLDFWMDAMMSMHFSKDDTTLQPDFVNFEPAEAAVRRVRRHKITGTVPGILHFNGNGKNWMESFAKSSWWRNTTLLARGSVVFRTVGGETVQWEPVCSRFYLTWPQWIASLLDSSVLF